MESKQIFDAVIEHEVDGEQEEIWSLFKTYFHDVATRIFERKPGFVLSAFGEAGGVIRLDDNFAVGLEVNSSGNFSDVRGKKISSFEVFCLSGNAKPSAGEVVFDEAFEKNPVSFFGQTRLIPVSEVDIELSAEVVVADQKLTSSWQRKTISDSKIFVIEDPLGGVLKDVLSDRAIAGRNSRGISVVPIEGTKDFVSTGYSVQTEWAKTDPYAMGTACVDQCLRRLTASGADPDRIALSSLTCSSETGSLIEMVKGIAKAAEVYQAPFISATNESVEPSIPTTGLISGVGIIDGSDQVIPGTLQGSDSVIAVIGSTENPLGGGVLARRLGLADACVPETNLKKNIALYKTCYDGVKCGWIRSAREVAEGGLAVALVKIAGSKAGLDINFDTLPVKGDLGKTSMLFNESPGRLVLEIRPDDLHMVSALFAGQAFGVIGHATTGHSQLIVEYGKETLIDEPFPELNAVWQSGLSFGS